MKDVQESRDDPENDFLEESDFNTLQEPLQKCSKEPVRFQEAPDLLHIMWSYLHDNQRLYYECAPMTDFDDLSEEQLLTLHVYNVETFMKQCVQVESIKALNTIHWDPYRLRDLIHFATRGRQCRTVILNYAMDTIANMPLKALHELNIQSMFLDSNVACKATCDWYREHELWDGDTIQEALHYDDAEWFAGEIKGDIASHIELVVSNSYRPVNILCWMASQVDLTPHVERIFNKFDVKSLPRVYEVMKLEKTCPFTVTKVYSREWLMFIHSHFTITNTPEELLVVDRRFRFKLEISLLYELDLPQDWTFALARHQDRETLKLLYDRHPDVFKTDITAIGFEIDNFRFAMTHGSYVTKPIVCLFPMGNVKEEDWELDLRLDPKILEDHIKHVLHSRYINDAECRWLMFILPQFYPHKNWRYNLLFSKVIAHYPSSWLDFMDVIVEYVDWKTIDVSKVINNLGSKLHHAVHYIDMNAALQRAITDNLKWFTTIHIACEKQNVPLTIDRDMLEHHWEELDEENQKSLLLLFPEACQGLKLKRPVHNVLQHILKRRKVGVNVFSNKFFFS